MGVPYDVFEDAFLQKVTEYDFINMPQHAQASIVDGYMKRACAQFNKMCNYDLVAFDDELREIQVDIDPADLDEIVNIVGLGMVVQWFQPYMFKQENLENVLSTKDFSMYSPAELLYRVREVYNVSKADFTFAMREYTYAHGDLSDLHL